MYILKHTDQHKKALMKIASHIEQCHGLNVLTAGSLSINIPTAIMECDMHGNLIMSSQLRITIDCMVKAYNFAKNTH